MSYEIDYNYNGVLKTLYEKLAEICENVYTSNRPLAVPEQMQEFAVVSVPGQMRARVHGGGYGAVSTYCTIELYVKLRKGGQENLVRIDELTKSVLRLFPISNDIMAASRPMLVLRGSDGLGFSAVLISAELLIK